MASTLPNAIENDADEAESDVREVSCLQTGPFGEAEDIGLILLLE
jgi:hypothetical protein